MAGHRAGGVYSPLSKGTIGDWTHPGMLRALGADDSVLGHRNRNGAICGFATEIASASSLLSRWRACALDRDCIAPLGSSRDNHRQDQAVLSVLMTGFEPAHQGRATTKRMGISLRNDKLGPADVETELGRLRGE